MYEERPVENLAAFVLAAMIGAGMLFAFQKYGQFTAKRAENKLREQMEDQAYRAANAAKVENA